jgi:hypothetical protein
LRTNSHRQTRFAAPLLVPALALLLTSAQAQQRALPLDVLRSGIEFSGSDVRGMQSDDLANPGFLWQERCQLRVMSRRGQWLHARRRRAISGI